MDNSEFLTKHKVASTALNFSKSLDLLIVDIPGDSWSVDSRHNLQSPDVDSYPLSYSLQQ